VGEIWKRFKEIVFASIDHFVPHIIVRKDPDPEYYNKEVKRLKVKVRRVYNKRKLGKRYQVELKRLSKELLATKKTAQETFLQGNCWSEFYKYVKRRKGNREIIRAIKDHNGRIITDTTEKANILNSYYASVFSCDRNTPEIKLANSGESFIINTKVIRKRLAKVGRNKSVGPDGFPGEILKLGGEDITPYLAGLLEISLKMLLSQGTGK
jgi:hypothetical protein